MSARFSVCEPKVHAWYLVTPATARKGYPVPPASASKRYPFAVSLPSISASPGTQSLPRPRARGSRLSLTLVSGGTQSLPRSQARGAQLWRRWYLILSQFQLRSLWGGAKVPRTAAALQVASARREVSHRTESTKASKLDGDRSTSWSASRPVTLSSPLTHWLYSALVVADCPNARLAQGAPEEDPGIWTPCHELPQGCPQHDALEGGPQPDTRAARLLRDT